jgi:hypothetical protein
MTDLERLAERVEAAERPILEWAGLRVGSRNEHCRICLGDARNLAQDRYFAKPEWGTPLAASCFVDQDSGALRLFVADYEMGRRLTARHSRTGSLKIAFGRTPAEERDALTAAALRARSAMEGDE